MTESNRRGSVECVKLSVVAGLIIAHVFSLAITAFRLKFRYSRKRLWFDDAFAGLVAMAKLIQVALHSPLPRPIEYRLNLAAYFFFLCKHLLMTFSPQNVLARADSAVLATLWHIPLHWNRFHNLGRSILQNGPELFEQQSLFLQPGAQIHSAVSSVDVFIDIAAFSANWYIFIQTQKKFGAQPNKKWLVYSGLSSNILTLIINVAFWASYLKSPSESHLFFVSMTNGVMIISSITCNSSTIVGIICSLLRSRKRASIVTQGTGVAPQAIALTRIEPMHNKIEETDNWDVVSKDTALACIKGDWVV
ncbi:hypothetical protein HYPSUDRAFT_56734 [Hypholoma sublateritium FD-334 SS-4]|uniref:Uncharacterized protein n=1 Tax=Hypholoma sublateritium (strain FD-334 SS-4) TaxID=945553 RepID=A0A0D2M7M1_HYPSF|nr:hypothetical protein HYPSUDRAFT_56734 [Hypholoma sublateritium FD-334 SS-4]